MNETSTVDKLSQKARRRLDATTAGTAILTSVIVLSGILSAVFFWQHSAAVFVGLPAVLSTALGLAIGLVPSEGAFFGWKRVRATKQNMTDSQMKASEWGLWAAVGFAVTNVIAIFVSSFTAIPEQVQLLSAWITFFALLLPIPTQFMLYAWFVVNEQTTVENHLQARLHALTHAAYIKSEEARIEALLQGAEAALEAQLNEYGREAGGAEAARVLRDGRRNIIGQYYDAGHEPARPARLTAAEVMAWLAANSDELRLAMPDDTPRHATIGENGAQPAGQGGSKSGNRPL